MADNDPFQLDPAIAQLIPVTDPSGDASSQQAPIKFQDLSSLLPAQGQQQTQQQAGAMPNIISMPAEQGFSLGRGNNKIQGIVMHSSDGTEKSDIQTLRGLDPEHQVSSHYYVTRDGRVYQFVNDQDTAWHAGQTVDNSHYGNSATIGIEQEHIDGKQDWPKAQIQASSALVANLRARYDLSQDQIYAHSQIAPERKQDPVDYPWSTFNQLVTQGLTPKGRQITQRQPLATSASPTWQDLSPFLSQ